MVVNRRLNSGEAVQMCPSNLPVVKQIHNNPYRRIPPSYSSYTSTAKAMPRKPSTATSFNERLFMDAYQLYNVDTAVRRRIAAGPSIHNWPWYPTPNFNIPTCKNL